MATTNDITGALMVSKSSEDYRDNYDSIFRKKSQGCTRSHPHENMGEECKELTEVAREKFYKALDERPVLPLTERASYKPHQNGFFPPDLKDKTIIKWPPL